MCHLTLKSGFSGKLTNFIIDSLTYQLNHLKAYPDLDPLGVERQNITSVLEVLKSERKTQREVNRNRSTTLPKNNFNLEDAIGGQTLRNDPAVQQADREQALRASQNTISSTNTLRPDFQYLERDKSEYDRYLKPGEFSGTPEELDRRVDQAKREEAINIALIVTGLAVAGYVIYRYNKRTINENP